MKKQGKIKRHLLHLDSEPDVIMIGIVTPEADYKISLIINANLNLNFKSTLPLISETETGEKVNFSSFKSTSEFNDNTFVLVSNKKGNYYLSKKLTGIDYLLVIRGSDIISTGSELISSLRQCREITGLFMLEDLSVTDTILLQID